MASISIIGNGNMARGIAAVAAKAGAGIQIVGRDADKAADAASAVGGTSATMGDALTGDIVVLAVPFAAIDDLTETYKDALAGKTVVDITNPVNVDTFDGLVVPTDSSATQVIAKALPGAHVVKAFNTNFAASLVPGTVGGQPTTVLVAGDDAGAKQGVVDLVNAGGLAGVDAGSLSRARELESIGFLQMKLAASEQIAWTGGFVLAT
ncbi:NADPH-dependent F420 reductase [Demequina sp.]|uniref:NADPH-dependent F420 reductase n=1 Tax=Demequina sp. TaxID=2050685 RepID=UPI0025C46697|nr:NADPH-dependent F420 reductase [Demequina sp.]